jgi:hypothetical protein
MSDTNQTVQPVDITGKEIINTDIQEDEILRPDHDIEQYWLSFKQSMTNFYALKTIPPRDIQAWSANLNLLQSEQKYTRIEKQIYNYMTLYGLDLLRVGSRYHLSILITNIRRWDKIAARHKILQSGHQDNIITILLEIAASFIKSGIDFDRLFDDIELYLIHNDYTKLVDYSIKNNKPAILDRLIKFNYYAVSEAIMVLTGLDLSEFLSAHISGKKLLEKINLARLANSY